MREERRREEKSRQVMRGEMQTDVLLLIINAVKGRAWV